VDTSIKKSEREKKKVKKATTFRRLPDRAWKGKSQTVCCHSGAMAGADGGCRSCQVSEQNRLARWWLASVAAAGDGTGRIFKILTGGRVEEWQSFTTNQGGVIEANGNL
jgi:hypothetical protein